MFWIFPFGQIQVASTLTPTQFSEFHSRLTDTASLQSFPVQILGIGCFSCVHSGCRTLHETSTFDAGDAAMLTFLLDKQGRSRRCQSCLHRAVEETPLSVQTLRSAKKKSDLLKSTTFPQPSRAQALLLALHAWPAPTAMFDKPDRGTSTAHNHGFRCSSLLALRTSFLGTLNRCILDIVSEVAQSGHLWLSSHAGVTRSR